ncbi:hypothetical protein [Pseudomonas kurunegalensis]|uniref:hypothetical protein n=1 Tax=Pseudomonas kurunegalensis TaxID=485880 RepID=UPI00256FBABA|nr:hypothetical protein [Pseudomonas kurunegalensis]WJD61187.1 hypothetical protein QQ992_19900 [Pseudomonas kurunegalensis]
MHDGIFMVWLKSSAARAAHREQARSYICFGPVSTAPSYVTALFLRRDIEACAKAFAREAHRNNWPETDVGASLLAMRRAGGARF